MKATKLRLPCQVTGCTKSQHSQHAYCADHLQRQAKNGTPNGIALSISQRRSYISACLAVLHRLYKHKHPPTRLHLDAITSTLRNRIERELPLRSWRSYRPTRKAQAMLTNIHKRFGDHASLVLTATSLGVAMSLKYEPGVSQDGTYGQYQQMRALSSLMKRETITAHNGVVLSSVRPVPTGKNVVFHLHRLLVHECLAYLKDAGQEFERQVLTYIVNHHPQRAIRLPRRKQKL